ncbi:cystathionine beta-lyase [Oleiagrimonas sp.]|uniref:cystathionine beta-lyase n=1 Tax=Oleiagrimonas sp. TaxID=2010330 RepID=UPI00263641E4|nr:cystathionine beta-lyase [Oleiagrimonas sp.]MDA3913976.1 cystathionine beta-lyase [Oleiagrimonas sp.]
MHWKTRLLHMTAKVPEGFRSLVSPVHRGSTVVFDRQRDAHDNWRADQEGYAYGLFGTPTVLELGARIADLEGARHSFVVPSGMAAIALVYLACCRPGDHVLLPWSAYGPNVELTRFLTDFGVEIEQYDPMLGEDLASRIRENTALVWVESPGSITMEVQDVPAIVKAAHERGVQVALDNTYAAGVLFDAFAAGVDISIQALTKYVGGHSDLLMGSVSVRDDSGYERIGSTWRLLGMGVSPDDASRALRGLQTMGLRLEQLERSTLIVARWLKDQPQIARVLHPALPDCVGHEFWKRDFTGSASLFSVVFAPQVTAAQVSDLADALQLFDAGYSWGGVRSLAMTYPTRRDLARRYGGEILRLNIGLEAPDDLIADLQAALGTLR